MASTLFIIMKNKNGGCSFIFTTITSLSDE